MGPELITDAWLRQECDGGAFTRGRRYFEQQRARVLRAEEMARGSGLTVHGECEGSEYQPYVQTVDIYQDGHRLVMDAVCSCPVGRNCKHAVALMLTWRESAALMQPEIDPISAWLTRLTDTQTTQTDPGNEALLYRLQLPESPRTHLSVDLVVARRRRDGGWTKARVASPQTLYDHWRSPDYLQAVDRPILSLIRAGGLAGWSQPGSHDPGAAYLALLRMLETGRLFAGRERRGPLQPGQTRHLRLAWRKVDKQYELAAVLEPKATILPVDPPLYLDPHALELGAVALPEGVDDKKLAVLRAAPPIPAKAAVRASRQIARTLPHLPTPSPVRWEDRRAPPTPCLAIHFQPHAAQTSTATLSFDYAGESVRGDDPRTVIVTEDQDGLVRIHRDPGAEQQAVKRLTALGLTGTSPPADPTFQLEGTGDGHGARDAWLAWIEKARPELESEGWTVSINEQGQFGLSRADEIHGELESSGNDWFGLRFDLTFDGWTIPLVPLVGQLIEHYRPGNLPATLYLDVGDNHYVSVPAERIEPILKILFDLFDRVRDEQLMLARPDAASLADLDGLSISGDTSLLKLVRQLSDFSGLKRVRLPTTFKGQLRDYQQHGVDWMQFLREHQLSGILADDMGLGKTVQTLAHLAVEKRAGRMRQPCLIVAPTSLMGNWRREIEHFTPKLTAAVSHGPSRAELFEQFDDFDVVLTTYPLLLRDRQALLSRHWHYLILDEAQQIKNPLAQAARIVRAIKTNHRLCLTGTPMENHLGELWAQFDFLMPGFLGDHRHFSQHYRNPIEKHGDQERLQSLTRRTAPFLLRRTKERVAAELPPKTDIQRSATLGDKQALLYEAVRLTMEKKVRKAIAARGLARSHIVVLEALLKLRQVCCDPRLLPPGTPGVKGADSAKFELLFDLLPTLLEEGRRVLLFSQFTTMLGLIEKELDQRQITYSKLTGQTRKRDQAIARFTSGEVNLFLVSLKAGGVGLNLTEADTVIHYDPWWNPAVEHQATDRAHRIGQDKPVFVYKLLTEGTVEEKIVTLQEKKQRLAEAVHGGGRGGNEPPITEETIQSLLAER